MTEKMLVGCIRATVCMHFEAKRPRLRRGNIWFQVEKSAATNGRFYTYQAGGVSPPSG